MSQNIPQPRSYQQELLEESLKRNTIIALDTGSGKTHIAVLRIKAEIADENVKVSWFLAPTVSLCQQQRDVIAVALPVSVGLISGYLQPEQWKDASLWQKMLESHRVVVSTPQVLLDALRHGYIVLDRDISLLVFDEAHHAVENHPYNRIMAEFYFKPPSDQSNSRFPRPMILGLTASPVFGGDVGEAFRAIERNLDSTIRTTQHHQEDLAKYVHRPQFKYIVYEGVDPNNSSFSTNLATLDFVVCQMNIEEDPYVKTLRRQLSRLSPQSTDWGRLDQKLSSTLQKKSTLTHKGLRDFARCARDIYQELGAWAADWYVYHVVEQAKMSSDFHNDILLTWRDEEKSYLLNHLTKVVVTPVSYDPHDIMNDSSNKVRKLVECLLLEKQNTDTRNEFYSGIIFVQRRDTVITLAALLRNHPETKSLFRIGCLLGVSNIRHQHSFMDVTRTMIDQVQEDILADFRIGEKNLLISTSVAEEGIDIQACGSVVRWDPPPNMVSWAQSRGRARQKRSTFTLMFENGSDHQNTVSQWERLEYEMLGLYNDHRRLLETTTAAAESLILNGEGDDDDDDDEFFRVSSTGAILTLHSAIHHLSHFCAVIPNASHVDHRPVYDIDPPDLPEGWHSFEPETREVRPPQGPFASTVRLPRLLPLELRVFKTEKRYRTKISAHRHAAFKAYRALYEAEMLNDHLLPLTSVVEPELEEEVKAMLKRVEKRSGTTLVSFQMDPWMPTGGSNIWWCSELHVDGLPSLQVFTRCHPAPWGRTDGPTLYRPGYDPLKTQLLIKGTVDILDERITKAQEYTRRLFWAAHGSRMHWNDLDFHYLFLPIIDSPDDIWDIRRRWVADTEPMQGQARSDMLFMNAALFGEHFSYPNDIAIIRRRVMFGKPYRFVSWRFDKLSEEELTLKERMSYGHPEDYPLLEVQELPPKTNFLLPPPVISSKVFRRNRSLFIDPRHSLITLLSRHELDYSYLLPSILRHLAMSVTIKSLRDTLFRNTALDSMPDQLLAVAVTSPLSQERYNYQRLETLGDTVLKFLVGIQLLSRYPLWHEGYLARKKDHTVSNVRLAKDAVAKKLYLWIIRDRMLGRKWRPTYFSTINRGNSKNPRLAATQELSTKVLADVVESLIGAAYLHGGCNLGLECTRLFGLGIEWVSLPKCIETMLSRVEHQDDSTILQCAHVEQMLGYTFKRKMLLVEALTHANYQVNTRTVSYERMEFLGDSVLDIIVTDYLYHAPGKEYSPGHIHLRRAAVVNAHILGYICLRTRLDLESVMPTTAGEGSVSLKAEKKPVYLWQFLLHSSHRVLDDQRDAFTRYKKGKDEIEEALQNGSIFPWAALLRLQAPKFFSDMIESLLGAVYLDSGGNIDIARYVVRKLGIMQVLEHIVNDGVDVLHPVSRLSMWATKLDKKVDYNIEKEKGSISCVIYVDGVEEARISDEYRGRASQEEVRYLAAEKAIQQLHLRNVGVNYETLKRKKLAKLKAENGIPQLNNIIAN